MASAIASIGVTCILFVGVLATRGRFEEFFTDFGYVDFQATLPALTNGVRSTCFVAVVGLLFAMTVIKEFLLKSKPARAACNTAAFYGALLLGALYVMGMFLPLNVLIERVSQ
jgi:hypothetical protein